MQKRCGNFGSYDAKLILIGEAPGYHEEMQGVPFVGNSGHKLDVWWEACGLKRNQFFITNVYNFRPPNNEILKIPEAAIAVAVEELHEELKKLTDPYIIVPTGNTALKALTGKEGIMKWRGSILSYTDRVGRTVKVIPTIHPAATMRMSELEGRCYSDWQRVAEEAEFKELRLPERRHIIKPDLVGISSYHKLLQHRPEIPLSIDIETHPQSGITCIGFAANAVTSITIPLGLKRKVKSESKRADPEFKKRLEAYWLERVSSALSGISTLEGKKLSKPQEKALAKWNSEHKVLKTLEKMLIAWEEKREIITKPVPEKQIGFVSIGYWKIEDEAAEALALVKQICELPNPKILQNGFYDIYWLWWYGINVANYQWDTMNMHHCLFPTDPHSLDYMASIFTKEPYWKDDTKTSGATDKWASNSEILWTYNGKDCCVTYEIYEVLLKLLEDHGKLEFYKKHYQELYEPVMAMMKHGIRVDQEKMKSLSRWYSAELVEIVEEINALAGENLAGKVKVSPAKLKKYFYETLRLPEQKRRRAGGERTSSADEVAVRSLILRYPDRAGPVGTLYLQSQRLSTMKGFVNEQRVDADGRFRSSYGFTTETGRFKSSSNPLGSGANAQNQDRELREIFLADEGMFLLEVDMSQIESRIIYMLTRSPKLIEMAQSKPWERDMHTEEAFEIFRAAGQAQTIEDITKEMRYIGKKVVHGAQRGLMGKKLSDVLLKESKGSLVMTEQECDGLLEAYHASKPEIRNVYFEEVAKTMRRDRMLVNSWGRWIYWPQYLRFTDDIYRQGYSFLPQSDAVDLLNQRGLKSGYQFIKDQKMKSRIHIQRHDALVISTTLNEGYILARGLKFWLGKSIQYGDHSLSVPISLKLSKTDGEGIEFKKFPSEEEFNETARRLL